MNEAYGYAPQYLTTNMGQINPIDSGASNTAIGNPQGSEAESRAYYNSVQSASSPIPVNPAINQAPMLGAANIAPIAQATPVALPTQYQNPAQINQGGIQAPPTGLIGSEQALLGGYQGAENLLLGGHQTGASANDLQASLSGALGQQAQQEAYQNYQNSPAMKYQMEQMQRAVEHSAAARGGLLGGNTLTELQRNAAGIASQDYQNQFNNLGQVADRGAQLTGMLANLRNNLGMNVSSGRTNAGMAIAQNASNTANNISSLLNQQGINVSSNLSNSINTISSMLHDYGMQDSVDANSLAQILANISGGQASNLQQGYQNVGNSQAAGVLGTNSAIQNGLTQAIQLGAFGSNNQGTGYNSTPQTNVIGTNYGSNIA